MNAIIEGPLQAKRGQPKRFRRSRIWLGLADDLIWGGGTNSRRSNRAATKNQVPLKGLPRVKKSDCGNRRGLPNSVRASRLRSGLTRIVGGCSAAIGGGRGYARAIVVRRCHHGAHPYRSRKKMRQFVDTPHVSSKGGEK